LQHLWIYGGRTCPDLMLKQKQLRGLRRHAVPSGCKPFPTTLSRIEDMPRCRCCRAAPLSWSTVAANHSQQQDAFPCEGREAVWNYKIDVGGGDLLDLGEATVCTEGFVIKEHRLWVNLRQTWLAAMNMKDLIYICINRD
jgi:hypothetical protein